MTRNWQRLLYSVLILGISATLCIRPLPARASPPQPADRFRWVEGLDDLYPREHGPVLSRPADSRGQAEIPLPDPSFVVDFKHYPTSAEVGTFLSQLQGAYPGLVATEVVGQSSQGRPIHLVRLGSPVTDDGISRPALYVDGQHHAQEAIGAQVALYFVWYLASHYGSDPVVTRLLDTRTVYAIPCVNPDGTDIFVSLDQRQRRTATLNTSDDDGDGQYDEDGREGAGYGTHEVYHYTFDAAWVAQHPADPFVNDWWLHASSQFVGLYDGEGQELPQADDDGDGRFGEDPPGGVDANRNYDSHWDLGNSNPRSNVYRGPAAFSEPEARAVRDWAMAHPNIATALSFHSGNDLLLHPWCWSTSAALPDRYWFETMSRKGSQLSEKNGFLGSPHLWTARGLYLSPGSTIDWLYDQGIMAWSPEAYGASGLSYTQRVTTSDTYSVGTSIGEAFNPAPADIALTADRWLSWSLYVLAATPNVGLDGAAVLSETLAFTVTNDGLLPLDVQVTAQTDQGIYTTTLADLSAGLRRWAIPWPTAPEPRVVTLTLAATSRVGASLRPQQVETLRLEIAGQILRVTTGRMEPFVNLASFFAGWFAGAGWDGATYHRGAPLLLAGDVDGNCQVTIMDIMLVANRWRARIGDTNYDSRFDLDGNNEITIMDIMSVATQWGNTCGSAGVLADGSGAAALTAGAP